MGLTRQQLINLVITVKCTAPLSICGSAWIIQEVLRDPRKRNMVYHRLLLAMSVSDVWNSIWMFIGNWAIPMDTTGVYMPRGNILSCNTQGFSIQLGIMTPIYNASLSLYYLLIINYGWKEASLRKIEPYFHLLAMFWGFGTAITGVAWEQYHNANLWCWFSTTPESNILRWVCFYGPVWIALTFVTITMLMVCHNVYSKEKKLDRYEFSSITKHTTQQQQQNNRMQEKAIKHRKQSQRVAVQSFWYIVAFYAAFIFASLTRLIQTINGKTYYTLLLLFAIFSPMQGFMNFCVYVRPKVIQYRKDKRRRDNSNATGINTADANSNTHSTGVSKYIVSRLSVLSSKSNLDSSINSIQSLHSLPLEDIEEPTVALSTVNIKRDLSQILESSRENNISGSFYWKSSAEEKAEELSCPLGNGTAARSSASSTEHGSIRNQHTLNVDANELSQIMSTNTQSHAAEVRGSKNNITSIIEEEEWEDQSSNDLKDFVQDRLDAADTVPSTGESTSISLATDRSSSAIVQFHNNTTNEIMDTDAIVINR